MRADSPCYTSRKIKSQLRLTETERVSGLRVTRSVSLTALLLIIYHISNFYLVLRPFKQGLLTHLLEHFEIKEPTPIVSPQPHFQAPPSFLSLAVQKSGRGPGVIYHMSDVEGREKVIERRWIIDTCLRM